MYTRSLLIWNAEHVDLRTILCSVGATQTAEFVRISFV